MDQITVSDVTAIVSEIKPEAVKMHGLQGMLRRLSMFFGDEDIHLIKHDMEIKGPIHAWDRFLDALQYAGVDAFKEYVRVLFSSDFKCTKGFQDTISEVCRGRGLDISELIRERDDSCKRFSFHFYLSLYTQLLIRPTVTIVPSNALINQLHWNALTGTGPQLPSGGGGLGRVGAGKSIHVLF